MGGFIIIDEDKQGIRGEMHERMNGMIHTNGGYRTTNNREYEHGYRDGYEHGYRDHERDMDERVEYRNTRYGRM